MKTTTGSLVRPTYNLCEVLSSRDLQDQQRYLARRLTNHNRFLHNWGVLCGLLVAPAAKPRQPWAVHICPGYAIDCCGNEIIVGKRKLVDIREHLWKAPRKPAPNSAYVSIRFDQKEIRPIPAKQPGCGCEETIYRPSRIQDSFRIDILWSRPKVLDRDSIDICQPHIPDCPTCTDNHRLVLAAIRLPKSEHEPITIDHINNGFNRFER